MSKLIYLILLMTLSISLMAQSISRKELDVPKVDPSSITLDGVMDETE